MHASPLRRRFDVPAFYREARRVLRPGGALAAWAYMPNAMSFPDSLEAGGSLLLALLRASRVA